MIFSECCRGIGNMAIKYYFCLTDAPTVLRTVVLTYSSGKFSHDILRQISQNITFALQAITRNELDFEHTRSTFILLVEIINEWQTYPKAAVCNAIRGVGHICKYVSNQAMNMRSHKWECVTQMLHFYQDAINRGRMPNVNDHFCCIISDVVRSGDGQIFDSLLESHLVNVLYEILRTTDQNCQAIKFNIYYLITEADR